MQQVSHLHLEEYTVFPLLLLGLRQHSYQSIVDAMLMHRGSSVLTGQSHLTLANQVVVAEYWCLHTLQVQLDFYFFHLSI